jgi:hypothetical protein
MQGELGRGGGSTGRWSGVLGGELGSGGSWAGAGAAHGGGPARDEGSGQGRLLGGGWAWAAVDARRWASERVEASWLRGALVRGCRRARARRG